MSIINVIANLESQRPFASGYARKAYYSKRYNVVIKRTRGTRDDNQTLCEASLWENMTEKEKLATPILQVLKYKGLTHIIAEKCTLLSQVIGFASYDRYDPFDDIRRVLNNIKPESIDLVEFVCDKYSITDLHKENLAISPDNRLVIIDMGFSGDSDEYKGPIYDDDDDDDDRQTNSDRTDTNMYTDTSTGTDKGSTI